MNEFESKYYVERKNTGSAKWDGLKGMFGEAELLPLWVADMDFKSPGCVEEALKAYIDQSVYGYYIPPAAYFESFINWEKNRHGYSMDKDWIRFTPGVVSGIYRFVSAFTKPEEACIILSPCYYPFMHAVEDCGRRLICSLMINDQGRYEIDYKDFEEKIIADKVKLFILCSPHNPVGRVWTRDELGKLLDICKRHEVIVVSDEIHQDILFKSRHIPTATVDNSNDFVVTLTAASKTFNLAGFNHSFAVIPNKALRDSFDECSKTVHVSGTTLGYVATRAAYEGGSVWLEGLLETIAENAEYLREQFKLHLPKAIVSPLEGTYLIWIDLKDYLAPEQIKEVVQGKCKLAVDYGSWFYHGDMGKEDCHIRMNLATKKENIAEAVDRLITELNNNI